MRASRLSPGAYGSDFSFNSDGNLVFMARYGTLTIDANGQYTYVLDDKTHRTTGRTFSPIR